MTESFAGGIGVGPSDHARISLSNPVNALAVLLYANHSWLPSDVTSTLKRRARKEGLDSTLEEAVAKQEQPRLIGAFAKYRQYLDGVAESLKEFRGHPVIFLDPLNLCLQDEWAQYRRLGIDDFSSITAPAEHLVSLYLRLPKRVQSQMREIIFWRMAPYDFPFMIKGHGVPGIVNPFKAVANDVSDRMLKADRMPLGSSERLIGDDLCQSNYRFSPAILSVKRFREINRTPESRGEWLRRHGLLEKTSDYHEIDAAWRGLAPALELAITANRELLKLKYAWLCDQLGLREVQAYMLNGDVGFELLKGSRKDAQIVAGKLLRNTKDMPLGGVLEPAAINLLSGWLNARYGDGVMPPVTISAPALQAGPELVRSVKYPFLTTLGPSRETEEHIKRADKEALELLRNDTRMYSFGIYPVEVILVMLNNGNYPVYTKDGIAPWRNLLAGAKVQPLPIKRLESRLERPQFPGDAGCLLRPSQASAKCEYHKFLTILPDSYWETRGLEFEDNPFAKSGTLLHRISNSYTTTQHLLLPKYGINPTPRDEYCEVSIADGFRPEPEQWELARKMLEKKHEKSRSPLHKEMLERLDALRDTGVVLSNGGSPDVVMVVEGTNDIVIGDFKRNVAGFYPKRSFWEQEAQYWLILRQLLGIESKSCYTAIFQTPYSPNKFLPDPIMPFEGRYRPQIQRIRLIRDGEQFIIFAGANMILSYLSGEVFRQDFRKGMLCRQLYKDIPDNATGTASCKKCYMNLPEAFQCRFLLTEGIGPWPEEAVGDITDISSGS